MAEKTVTLYTRQNDKTLRQLKRDGRIINHRAYVEMHFGTLRRSLWRATIGLRKRRQSVCQSLRMSMLRFGAL